MATPKFEFTEPTTVKVTSVTNRVEKHGDENKPAQSYGFKYTGANTILDIVSPSLRQAIYRALEEAPQGILPSVEPPTPLLRTNAVESYKIKGKLDGWTLSVLHAVEDDLVMGSCKVDAFQVIAHEGGTVDLLFRVGTSDISPTGAGEMWSKNGEEVEILLNAPKVKEEAIDGSQGGGGPGFSEGSVQPAGDTQTGSLFDGGEPPAGGQKSATDQFIERHAGADDGGPRNSDDDAGEGTEENADEPAET
jgi:hypothetical protein